MKFKLPKIKKTELELLFKKCTNFKNECPFCNNKILYSIEQGKRYKCKKCKKKFRNWTKTYLENHRLSKKGIYQVIWCFIHGKTGSECSRITTLPYQTVFNLYHTIRKALPIEKIPTNQVKSYKKYEEEYLNKFKGISKKNKNIYKKEIKWQYKNRNKNNKSNKILCYLLSKIK